jgi:hypothetical protein
MLFGLFITLFLGIFQPFGLGSYHGTWQVAIGYGMVTFLAMSMLDLALIIGRVEAERWTLGKELLFSLLNILVIGLLNAIYSTWMGIAPFTLETIALFTLFTFAVGVFPVTVMVLINFQRSKTRYAQASDRINEAMHGVPDHPMEIPAARMIVLVGENQGERLEVEEDALLYLRSADNYVEVFHRAREVERTVLRGALRSFEEQLQDRPKFFRCHKSYVVNMDLVERVSGNAQGLKLHLAGGGGEVPVSRMLTAEVRTRLTVHPAGPSRSSQGVPVHPKS